MARLSATALRLLSEAAAPSERAAFGAFAPAAEDVAAPAIVNRTPSFLTDEGLPVQTKKGLRDFAKAQEEASAYMEDKPKGFGPMDLSSAGQVPDVPQVALERYVPPRGISSRMKDALEDPNVIEGIDSSIQTGIGLGADKWYHTEPIRRAYVAQLGPEQGAEAFRRYMSLVAATSPRSDVPTNIRNASFYNTLLESGADYSRKNPAPFGHLAQSLHKQNVDTLRRDNSLSAASSNNFGWDVLQNPKPASFTENLIGNLEPGTMDTHAFRNIGMSSKDPRFLATSVSELSKTDKPGADTVMARFGEIKPKPNSDKFIVTYRPQKLFEKGRLSLDEALKTPAFWTPKPNANEYAAAEGLYKQRGQKVGLPTADAQAASWAGAGELTGLGTVADKTFPEMLNERVAFTARLRGEDPQQTLRDFIARKKPLLSVAGLMALTGAEVAKHDGAPAGGAV